VGEVLNIGHRTGNAIMRHHFKSVSQFSGGFTAPRIHRVQPNGHGTACNILAGVPICVCGVSTGSTSEQETVPIGFIDMTAFMTHTGSISRRNYFNSNSLGLGFISHKKSEHSIRPTIDSASQCFSLAVGSFANVRQIFKNYLPCTNQFSPSYKSFRSNMHGMFGYGCLMSGHSPEELSGITGSNRLYFGSGFSDIRKFLIQMIGYVKQFIIFGISSYKKPFKSLIDSNNNSFGFGFRDINFIRKVQVPLVSLEGDFGVFPVIREGSGIIKSDRVSPKSDPFFGSGKVPSPDDGDRRFFVNCKAPFFVSSLLSLVGSGNGSEKRARELRREIKFFAYGFIVNFRELIGVGVFLFKDYLGKPIKGIKPIWKDVIGFVIAVKFKFYSSYCFHIFKYSIFAVKYWKIINLKEYALLKHSILRTQFLPDHEGRGGIA